MRALTWRFAGFAVGESGPYEAWVRPLRASDCPGRRPLAQRSAKGHSGPLTCVSITTCSQGTEGKTLMSRIATPERCIRPGYLGSLNREWVRELADSPSPAHWRAHPSLRTHATLGAVIASLPGADPDTIDAVLLALVRLGHDGDDIARRTLLQTLLGRVQRMTYTARARGLQDPVSAALQAALEAIASYPLHRRSKVAARLAMDCLSHLPRGAQATELCSGDELLGELVHADQIAGRALVVDDGDRSRREAVDLLLWALDTCVLTPDEAALLAQVHLPPTDHGEHAPAPTFKQLACATATPAATLRKRASRATAKLTRAVLAR